MGWFVELGDLAHLTRFPGQYRSIGREGETALQDWVKGAEYCPARIGAAMHVPAII
jgi:hypothetical protein